MTNIDKDIPPPTRGTLSSILRKMEVGDSVLMDRSVQSNIWVVSRSIGIRTATKREGDSVRVWRIADE